MKKIYFFLFLFILNFSTFAQSAIITSIIDGTCNSGTHPRIIEIYIDGTMDVSSLHLQMQRPNLTAWLGTDNIGIGEYSNEFIYIVNDLDYFDAEYPGISTNNKTIGSVPPYFDGTSKVRIIDSDNDTVLDMYGIEGEDPTGTTWEYSNSYVQRKSGVFASNTFNEEDWTIYPVGNLDGKGSCNGSSQLYISTPIGIYSPSPDKEALIALYNATDGPNWTNPWDLNADISTWHGITVNTEGRVTEINLYNNSLSGYIPEAIGNLSNLTYLDLNSNNLTGNIPESIRNLSSLKYLLLSKNTLTGNISEFLENLNLISLSLGDNNFTGSIPEGIGNLTNLASLDLSNNNLTGNIPETIENLVKLRSFSLSDNNLTGNIPEAIGNLIDLQIFYLYNNSLSGNIPDAIGNLINLQHLGLNNINLEGVIPNEIGNLTNLRSLNLSNNDLTGNIPESIGNLVKLESIHLYNNNLSGNIPEAIGSLINLRYIYLDHNNLTGGIPESIKNFTNLTTLNLSNNYLEGNIPDFTTLSLDFLSLRSNSLVFEDIEPNYIFYTNNINHYYYSNQKLVDIEKNIELLKNEEFSITVEGTSSPNNTYQWRKNGINIEGATNGTYTISSVSGSDSGEYDCLINNTVVTDLTLYKNLTILNVLVPDSDNDGINDELDSCPNTPEEDDVNTNGCSQSQLDDDNDGVTNNLDQCPDTPNGENVNSNGCSQNQLDNDNDGIENGVDECPETPLGEIVNGKGCSQSDVLGNSPVQVMGVSTTCPDTNNGEIIIDANNNISNQIVVSGPNYNEIFSGLSGSENVIITDLAPGIYKVCVTYEGYEANYCSSVNIEETEELTSSKAQVDLQNKKASFYVSGSKHYEVLVNNILYKYNVDNTTTTKIEVPLEDGVNEVVLKTDKTCQGEKIQTINFVGLSFYPNPAEDYLNIAGLNDFTDIEVYITDLAGNRITSQVLNNSSSSLRIPLHNLSVGVYIVNIKTDTQTINTKIYKK